MLIPKIFIKVIRGLHALDVFRLQAFSGHYSILFNSKSSSDLARNKSLELILEHTLTLSLPHLWTF